MKTQRERCAARRDAASQGCTDELLRNAVAIRDESFNTRREMAARIAKLPLSLLAQIERRLTKIGTSC